MLARSIPSQAVYCVAHVLEGAAGATTAAPVLSFWFVDPPALLYPSVERTCKSIVPSFIPALDQASKWACVVMVPDCLLSFRTEIYWWKVEVPTMEGSFVRVVS